MKGYLLGAVLGLILGILADLLASWIERDLNFTPISITFIILLTILGIIIGAKLESQKTNSQKGAPTKRSDLWYWLFTAVICIAIIAFGLIVVFSGSFRSKPLTLYFVIDATEKMSPIFNTVQTQVQAVTTGLNGDTRIGLRVFGGGVGQPDSCQASRQMVAAVPYTTGTDLVVSSLSETIPQGHSSMTGAILQALLFDLQNENGRTVRLILITSGIDSLCDPPSGDLITDVVNKENVDLKIISIGEQDPQNIQIFKSYAQAFKGNYVPVPNIADLSTVVQQLSFYGYGYSPSYLFIATPTP